MTVYEIEFLKEKHNDFFKLVQQFDDKFDTDIFPIRNTIKVVSDEIRNFQNKSKNRDSDSHILLLSDRSFIDFLKESHFDFKLSERKG